MDNIDIESFIDAIRVDDFTNAQPMFAELMASKINDALDVEKIKVASDIFGATEDDEYSDDFDDIELSDEEIDDLIDDIEDDEESDDDEE